MTGMNLQALIGEISLRGRKVLVVEDEYFLADELKRTLGNAGATVLGPAPTVEAALLLLDQDDDDPHAAVLDVNLGGELVYPVADALLARNIPFLFATGYDRGVLPEHHAAVRWLEKPLDKLLILQEIDGLLRFLDAEPDEKPALPFLVGQKPVTHVRNGLLDRLSVEDRSLILPNLERVVLRRGDVIFERSMPIEHVYFIESGMSSEIAVNTDDNKIEVGCVGREGLAGIAAVLGVNRSSHRTFMQIGGTAVRIAARDLQEAMDASRSLRMLLLRYVHVFMMQIAATVLSDGRYTVEQRLARWLLMAHDRVGGTEVPLTHDLLALMLGVRRAGVTEATHILEGEGAVKARRGRITVRDRSKLIAFAGASYGEPEAEYRRLMGTVATS